ncbi:MAG: hypothetical protein QGH49_00640 [SAR324 cluster bacterium]|jgi:hypothetical protein|nr:hypothetical protein [SAR324 cluster bacterium]
MNRIPEKPRLLKILKDDGFNVPDFYFISGEDFDEGDFLELQEFLNRSCTSFKVIVRSAHPQEDRFKGGTFDSLETNCDITGVQYARNRITKLARHAKRLNILRQQKFNGAPQIDIDQMGIMVMQYIEGLQVMAKQLGDQWEFGISGFAKEKVPVESYITRRPPDERLLELSDTIQRYLGFRCEIEYILDYSGVIHVVQARDISLIDLLEQNRFEQTLRLDGIRRLRKRNNYRERVIYAMDNPSIYERIMAMSSELLREQERVEEKFGKILKVIEEYEQELEQFSLKYQYYAVLGLKIRIPDELFHKASHCLNELPDYQARLTQVLLENQYQIDYFLSEADTILAKDRLHLNLCTHAAYGVDSVRNPLWFIHWTPEHHDAVVNQFRKLGFKTKDMIGIEISPEERPMVYRL